MTDLGSLDEWHLRDHRSVGDNLERLFSYLVWPGDRYVDAGARIDVHTVPMVKLAGPHGEAIAVESDPRLARRAAENVALNGPANAQVLQAAASGPDSHPTASAPPVRSIAVDEACPGPVALIKVDGPGIKRPPQSAPLRLSRDTPLPPFSGVDPKS